MFRRSFAKDLVGMVGQTEDDGFIRVTQKKNTWATDPPLSSRRVTRS